MDNRKAYAGFCQHCNRVVCVSVDDPDYHEFALNDCQDMLKEGYTVKYLTVDEIHAMPFGHEDECADKKSRLFS